MRTYGRLLALADRLSDSGLNGQALQLRTAARRVLVAANDGYIFHKKTMETATQNLLKKLRTIKSEDEDITELIGRMIPALEHLDIEHVFVADPDKKSYPYGNCDGNLYGPLYGQVQALWEKLGSDVGLEARTWLKAFSVCRP